MAITHDDLSRRTRHRATNTTSKLALLLVVLSVLSGLSSFILCLSAEASRSEATWFVKSSPADGTVSECVYSGSGKTPLGCAIACIPPPRCRDVYRTLLYACLAYQPVVACTRGLGNAIHRPWCSVAVVQSAYMAGVLLVLTTWVCFAVAEVLLMIGLSVESGHLTRWKDFRSRCTIIRPGLFAAAGVLGLTTVFLGVGLYLTALRMQRLHQEDQGTSALPHSQRQWVTPSAPRAPQESQPLPKASASV